MSADLIGELMALELPLAAARRLIGMGVAAETMSALHVNGDLAVGDVDLARDGRFEFGGPDRRLILAVRDRGEVIDLAALSSTCEDEWALRLGAADFLGVDALYDAQLAERRELRLFATPMGWLRGGCAGVCVLDWTPGALAALRGLGPGCTIIADNGAKAKLQAMLAHGGLPLVAEEHQMRRAA